MASTGSFGFAIIEGLDLQSRLRTLGKCFEYSLNMCRGVTADEPTTSAQSASSIPPFLFAGSDPEPKAACITVISVISHNCGHGNCNINSRKPLPSMRQRHVNDFMNYYYVDFALTPGDISMRIGAIVREGEMRLLYV
jgi:hypothetical protein